MIYDRFGGRLELVEKFVPRLSDVAREGLSPHWHVHARFIDERGRVEEVCEVQLRADDGRAEIAHALSQLREARRPAAGDEE